MSTTTLPVIRLQSCPKGYTRDLDKTISPQETYERVQARMQAAGLDILAEVRRVDVGRLGIPVYLSVCGRDARGIMPTRKQMGKGSSPEQARASALMELMERFAFFSFWQRLPHMVSATWAEAEERFGKDLLPIEEICRSVDDSLSPEQAREAMSTLRWNFFPATHLADGRIVWLPLDWFKLLGEFNGTSAGNSPEESLLQGLSELVERHVCCRIDRERLTTPTIDPHEVDDPTLRDLLAAAKPADGEKLKIAIVTGAEGGFAAEEAEMAAKAGARTVGLGPRILRCETAPLAVLASVMTLTGNLE